MQQRRDPRQPSAHNWAHTGGVTSCRTCGYYLVRAPLARDWACRDLCPPSAHQPRLAGESRARHGFLEAHFRSAGANEWARRLCPATPLPEPVGPLVPSAVSGPRNCPCPAGCGKRFQTEYAARRHGEDCTGCLPQCPTGCGTPIKTKGALAMHVRFCDGTPCTPPPPVLAPVKVLGPGSPRGTVTWHCPYDCGKTFRTPAEARKHASKCQDLARPCAKGCGRLFPKGGRRKHEAKCQGGATWECRHGCGKVFAKVGYATQHEAVCQSMEQPCAKGCGRVFRQNMGRANHEKRCTGVAASGSRDRP